MKTVKAGNDEEEFTTDIGRKLNLLQVSDPAAVLELAGAALNDPRWSANAFARCRCTSFMAAALRRFGRNAEAQARYLEAIGLAREADMPKLLCEITLHYAGLLIAVGHFVDATEVTSEALGMDLVLTDPLVATLALDCGADLAAALGWYDRARHFNNVALLAFACVMKTSLAHIEIQLWQTRCQYTLFELLDLRHAGYGSGWAAAVDRFHAEYGPARRRAAPDATDTDIEELQHLAQLVRWIEIEHDGSAAELTAVAEELHAQPPAAHGRYASCRRFAQALAAARLGYGDRARDGFEQSLANTLPGIPALRQAILHALADNHAAAGNWKDAYLIRRSAESERRIRVDQRVNQHVAALTDRLQRDRMHAQSLLSDDLRSPLAAIASLAADPGSRSPDHIAGLLAQVHSLANQALANTEEYLRFAHLQTLQAAQLELLLLPEVLADAIDELHATAAETASRIKVVIDDEGDEQGEGSAQTFMVHGHYTSLRRVFMQLLTHAGLAAPDGVVEVKLWRDESNVVMAISRQGDGLSLDALALLATGHHRTAQVTGATAGLRYVAAAVRNLGGAAFAANRDEGGVVMMMSFVRA